MGDDLDDYTFNVLKKRYDDYLKYMMSMYLNSQYKYNRRLNEDVEAVFYLLGFFRNKVFDD